MIEHTREPWRVGKCSASMGVVVSDEPVPEINGSDAVDYYGGHLVAESVTPANARRIVACVNACAGISTEELERGVIKESMDMVDRLSRESTALPTDCAGQNCHACANPCDKYIESLR